MWGGIIFGEQCELQNAMVVKACKSLWELLITTSKAEVENNPLTVYKDNLKGNLENFLISSKGKCYKKHFGCWRISSNWRFSRRFQEYHSYSTVLLGTVKKTLQRGYPGYMEMPYHPRFPTTFSEEVIIRMLKGHPRHSFREVMVAHGLHESQSRNKC